MLHLRVQSRGLHAQQSRGPGLVSVAMVERALDQLDFVALDLFIEIDAVVIESDVLFAIAIGGQLNLQAFNLACQRLCEEG